MAHKRANTDAIITLLADTTTVLDLRPFVAIVMRESGCTFEEIATVLGCSRQNAEAKVKTLQGKL